MIKRERTIDSIGDRSPYVATLPLQLQREKGNESSSTWKRWSIHYHRKESDAIGTPLYALIKEVRTSTNLPIWPYGRSHLLLKNGMIFYCRVSKHVWKPVYPFEMCNMKITRQINSYFLLDKRFRHCNQKMLWFDGFLAKFPQTLHYLFCEFMRTLSQTCLDTL